MTAAPDHGIAALPRLSAFEPVHGVIRTTPDDFQVTEELGFEPSGSGPHWYLNVENRGDSTAHVARRLARLFGVAARDVGFSGLKDRHALTRQWFSVPAGGVDPAALAPEPGLRLLAISRNPRKLKRGVHRANRFVIVVRAVATDTATLAATIADEAGRGVPNYFGPQRFGRDNANLALARRLFAGRRLSRAERGFALSAARGWLFNAIAGERVRRGAVGCFVTGDLANLDGRGSVFDPAPGDTGLAARARALDIHPVGTLWGRGGSRLHGEAAALEDSVAAAHADLADGLANSAVAASVRALRLAIRDLRIDPEPGSLTLSFRLARGAYATTVLREWFALEDAARPGGAGPR